MRHLQSRNIKVRYVEVFYNGSGCLRVGLSKEYFQSSQQKKFKLFQKKLKTTFYSKVNASVKKLPFEVKKMAEY